MKFLSYCLFALLASFAHGDKAGAGGGLSRRRLGANKPAANEEGTSVRISEQEIIDGTYKLFSLDFTTEDVFTTKGSYKGQVDGLFCKIDMSAQKEDPSKGESTTPTHSIASPRRPLLISSSYSFVLLPFACQ